MLALQTDTGVLASVGDRLSSALGEVSSTPVIMFDAGWKLRVTTNLADWRAVSERATTYSPSRR